MLNSQRCLDAARVLEVAARKLRKLSVNDPTWRPHDTSGSILVEAIEDAEGGVKVAKDLRALYLGGTKGGREHATLPSSVEE